MKQVAVYPGTFDPITQGHMDLIERASRLFDRLILAVAVSARKAPFFDLADRMAMCQAVAAESDNVEVKKLEGLVVDFARDNGASILLRGLRMVSDFDYEFQLSSMNRRMAPELETIYLPATEGTSYISATIVKEIITLGGDVSPFVHPVVLDFIKKKGPQ